MHYKIIIKLYIHSIHKLKIMTVYMFTMNLTYINEVIFTELFVVQILLHYQLVIKLRNSIEISTFELFLLLYYTHLLVISYYCKSVPIIDLTLHVLDKIQSYIFPFKSLVLCSK